MNKKDPKSIQAQVASATYFDTGKGTVRLSPGSIQELGLKVGDIVQIEGKRSTAAILLPANNEEKGTPLIYLDGLQRANARISIGEHVRVSAAEEKPAKHVTVVPAQKNTQLTGTAEALLHTLVNRVLQVGDFISTAVYRQTLDVPRDILTAEYFQPLLSERAFGLQEVRLQVLETSPQGNVRITPETEIQINREQIQNGQTEKSLSVNIIYEDIGGLGKAVEQARELIEFPLKYPDLFYRLGLNPPKAVLLHGPSGTGKASLARAVANEAVANFFLITGSELLGRTPGESEERLRNTFAEALKNPPALIFIDELDVFAPRRMGGVSESERRLINQLQSLMDGVNPRQNVAIIGSTSHIEAVSEILLRPGRFEHEILFDAPDSLDRMEILDIHTRGMPLSHNLDLNELARITHGFIGSDIATLTQEAAIEALRNNLLYVRWENATLPADVQAKLEVTFDNFVNALKRVYPSAAREFVVQTPDVTWDDIGGLEDVKREIREGICSQLKCPERFRSMGIRPAKGFLLFGAPGTGKTMLAKASAYHAGANFIAASSSDILAKWYGESDRQIARLFNRARKVAPTILFFDEIDALVPWRGVGMGESAVADRVVNTLLAEMDALGAQQGVIVIGATNRPTLLDHALLRPGRFDELIYVPVPDKKDRLAILKIHTKNMILADDVNLEEIADTTVRYTGADLQNLVRRAALHALREEQEGVKVTKKYFDFAFDETSASVSKEMEEEYTHLIDMLKRESPQARQRIGFLP